MMHFELKVNGQEITKVSVVRRRECPENGAGWFVYDWSAWRPDKDEPLRVCSYGTGELAHYYNDGIEELALRVLSAYKDLSKDVAAQCQGVSSVDAPTCENSVDLDENLGLPATFADVEK